MPTIEELEADPRWRPFSVIVLVKGRSEVVRCPTPGHFQKLRELVAKGVYGLVKTETRGTFTLERQLDEMLNGRGLATA